MNIRNKLKNYGVWIAFVSLTIIVLETVGIGINIPVIKQIVMAICGVLTALGLLSNPSNGKGFADVITDIEKTVLSFKELNENDNIKEVEKKEKN